ncbi:small GTP-binding protein [Histomonas meleagridis]|uniref:small GTP-binding protein n=1 Tax=Histomonas meleagridis TaxID=135588 RepID=UPI00355A354B|nr:small GTP-binding protein [Histomonas meleagridis]KAH0806757.1 small GTP-binding protein [Histomonas meleagridis]
METKSEPSETKLRVVLIGDKSVGKTSLVNRYFGGSFEDKPLPTICVNYFNHEHQYNGKTFNILVCDTAGEEEYNSISKLFYREAIAAICVFNICSKSSFESIEIWEKEFRTNVSTDFQKYAFVYIVANQIDAVKDSPSHVEESKANKLKNDLRAEKIFFTSAKVGTNVNEMFESLFEDACKKAILKNETCESSSPSPAPTLSNSSKSSCCK